MPVIGHQDIGQQAHPNSLLRGIDKPQEFFVIARAVEQAALLDTAVHDVHDTVRGDGPTDSRHTEAKGNERATSRSSAISVSGRTRDSP